MEDNIPQTVEEIEKSKWFKKLYKPEIIAGLESGAELWLKKHGTKSKVGRQLHAALQLYRQSKAGNVLTPRNVAILTFSILYVVWPMDALADIIPVIGWMDDIGVLSLVFTAIISSMATTGKKPGEEPKPELSESPADQPADAEKAP
jgi:uncharacterized membrane protein YkvA (DUF1232 family)